MRGTQGLGRRVWGEKLWQEKREEQETMQKQGMGLGKRVTGDLQPEDLEADEPEVRDEADDTVGDPAPTAAPASEPAEPEDAEDSEDVVEDPAPKAPIGTLSVSEIERTLAETNTMALFDEIMAAEFERPEGEPRKTALRALIDAEKRRETPRVEVIAELTAALQKK